MEPLKTKIKHKSPFHLFAEISILQKILIKQLKLIKKNGENIDYTVNFNFQEPSTLFVLAFRNSNDKVRR